MFASASPLRFGNRSSHLKSAVNFSISPPHQQFHFPFFNNSFTYYLILSRPTVSFPSNRLTHQLFVFVLPHQAVSLCLKAGLSTFSNRPTRILDKLFRACALRHSSVSD